MVKRLLDAGHSVTGYNRTRSKGDGLVAAGMSWADSPRVFAESSDVVFSMIAHNVALAAIAEGPDGVLAGLKKGAIYVDMSTVSPSAIRQLATQVEGQGAMMRLSLSSGVPERSPGTRGTLWLLM